MDVRIYAGFEGMLLIRDSADCRSDELDFIAKVRRRCNLTNIRIVTANKPFKFDATQEGSLFRRALHFFGASFVAEGHHWIDLGRAAAVGAYMLALRPEPINIGHDG